MDRKWLFCVLFLFTVASALAVTITTNNQDYSQGQTVQISVNACLQGSVLQVSNANTPNADLIYIREGQGNWQTTYNTHSDSSDGRYTLSASCGDGTTSQLSFCVDAPGCLAGTSASGGSGLGRCIANVSCSSFSYCNSILQQSRTCVDNNGCIPAKVEVVSCSACQESWVCSPWSACNTGQQLRTCTDEHGCGTLLQQPVLQQSCQQAVVPGPQQVSPKIPMPQVQKPSAVPFWKKYLVYLIGLAVLAVVGATLGILYARKHQHKAYNFDELKDWIKKEESMGTSDEDIQKILSQQTGWTSGEVAEAFKDLHKVH